MISGANLLLARIGLLVGLGLVWQAVATLDEGLQSSLPKVTDALSALWTLLGQWSFWEAVLQTIQSAAIGLGICIVAGVGLGLILSIRPIVYASASFVVDFLRTVPPLAIIPLGILLYGPTMKLDIMMVVAAATWPILLQTVYGVRDVDPALLDTARSYRMAAWRRVLLVVAPACAPAIATGIRISAAIALLLSLGTELIAGSPGLGHTIAVYQHDGAVAETYACILFAGMLGIGLNGLVRTAEGRLLEWHHAPRARAQR